MFVGVSISPIAQKHNPFLLDWISTPAAAAYSMRRLRSTYTGPLIRLRRSSDNAEQDFYSVSGGEALDVDAISTWLGGASGYVVTWYDQTGNGNHATQATAASQPLFVASAQNGRPGGRFDGVDDWLDALDSASFSWSGGGTLYVVYKAALAINQAVIRKGYEIVYQVTNANTRQAAYWDITDTQYVWNAGTHTGATEIVLVRVGSNAAQTIVNGTVAGFTTGDGINDKIASLRIGANMGGGWVLFGDIYEALIFSTALSDEEHKRLLANTNWYWRVY